MIANHNNFDELRLVSFNCNGVKNKLPIIAELCQNADIVLLQETWLLPVDLPLMNSVHKDYNAFPISSVDLGELLSGRPYGGLSLLWHKNFEHCCQILNFEDNRILGLTVKTRDRDLFTSHMTAMLTLMTIYYILGKLVQSLRSISPVKS